MRVTVLLGQVMTHGPGCAIILFPGGRPLIRIRRSFWPQPTSHLTPQAAYQSNPTVWTLSKLTIAFKVIAQLDGEALQYEHHDQDQEQDRDCDQGHDQGHGQDHKKMKMDEIG